MTMRLPPGVTLPGVGPGGIISTSSSVQEDIDNAPGIDDEWGDVGQD